MALKRLFQFLSRFGHINRDPSLSLEFPKNPRGLPTCDITTREVLLMLEQPDTTEPLGLRNRAILETLYSTGVRSNELRHVKVSNLNSEQGLLRVDVPKGGIQYQRVIPIGNTALHWVQRYLKEVRPLLVKVRYGAHNGPNNDKGYLFLNCRGTKMSNTAVLKVVKTALYKAGIRNKNIVTHSFRVSCATGMLKGRGNTLKGADIRWVQEQLGHSSIQSTTKYLRLVPSELKKMHSLHHPREARRQNIAQSAQK